MVSYPKIFHLGERHIKDILENVVIIEEKVDGSFFTFGCTQDGAVFARSKNKELFFGEENSQFKLAIDFVESRKDLLISRFKGVTFFGEYLQSPHHNVLSYERVPKNNIIIFDMYDEQMGFYPPDVKEDAGKWLDLETVPLLFKGNLETLSQEHLDMFFQIDSILGNVKIEGVVVKNYEKEVLIGSQLMPSLAKCVRQDFKEVLNKTWTSGKDKVETFIEGFRTDARWHKAIQYLRDSNELSEEPKDIGPLIKRVQQDIIEECEEDIKEGLYKLFIDQIKRKAVAGLPEFYKIYLTNTDL